jgi:hypothetical protein
MATIIKNMSALGIHKRILSSLIMTIRIIFFRRFAAKTAATKAQKHKPACRQAG